MNEVTMYTTNICPCCSHSKQLLAAKGIKAQEINVDNDPEQLREMLVKIGRRSVPQIFIGMHHIGGFHDMAALDREGHLDTLLGR